MKTERQKRMMRLWREVHSEEFRQLQREWYRKNGAAHYAARKTEHTQSSLKSRYGVKLSRGEIMSRIRSVSVLEVVARKLATERAGCVLQHQPRNVAGNPDYASKVNKVAVFVHGCFWHQCPKHFRMPKDNGGFWAAKIARNVVRYSESVSALVSAGWRVLTIWEHEVVAWAKGRGS